MTTTNENPQENPQVITGSNIDRFRLHVLHKALRLEILGMKRRGVSVYSIIKKELGFTGNKNSVYDQMTAFLSVVQS